MKNSDFEKYYQEGEMYLQSGNFMQASEYFKKSANANKNYAEAWHYAGLCLLRSNRMAEAGMHLRRAIVEYDKRIETENYSDYNAYQKACVYALLEEKENALNALEKAIKLNLDYAAQAISEENFSSFNQADEFLRIVKGKIAILNQYLYKGKKLKIQDLNEQQIRNRNIFLESLIIQGWQIEDYADVLNSEAGVSPQASGKFTKNELLLISLDYHLDEDLIYMELQNRIDKSDLQAYRLHSKDKVGELLQIIVASQEKINQENWSDLIESLIEVCDSVLLEMPDGRKVKVS